MEPILPGAEAAPSAPLAKYDDSFAEQPYMAFLAHAFSEEECLKIRSVFDAMRPLDGKLAGGQGKISNIRRCSVQWLEDDDDNGWIYRRLASVLAEINRAHFRFDLTDFGERLQLTRYEGDEEGFYDWHVDRGHSPVSRMRKLSLSIQLSHESEYEGGVLEINAEGTVIAAPRDIGTAVAFPSFALHRVAPVTGGVRHSLVAWLHGPHFR